MSIYFGTPSRMDSIADVIPLYGDGEFESATRSTVPLLSLLMHAPDVFREILRELDFPTEHDLHLEYTVSPPEGRGKASHTDVMLKAGASALAIEAKWTEPSYSTVRDWPKRDVPKSANQLAVLKGWLSILSARLGTTFLASDFDDVIYQMLHRAASAATAERPRLAYLSFTPSPDRRAATAAEIRTRLSDLWERLGKPESFPFYLVELETTPLESFAPLAALPKGEEATSLAVCAALQGGTPLFEFGRPVVTRIGSISKKS